MLSAPPPLCTPTHLIDVSTANPWEGGPGALEKGLNAQHFEETCATIE